MKKVLIIGATSAIAEALAHRLAQTGASVYLLGRSLPKLELIAASLKTRQGAQPFMGTINFDDFTTHEAAIKNAAASMGGLDTVVLCHGVLGDQKAGEADYPVAEAVFRVNCLSAISFLTHAANYFEKQGSGLIIAVSSVA